MRQNQERPEITKAWITDPVQVVLKDDASIGYIPDFIVRVDDDPADLLNLGFAVAADERRLGRLRILLARMNPDLAMGGDLLEKTGAGNLFMDPTTGQVRSGFIDDVAAWFIDSNYNGESFFVRHAHFTGANDPYWLLWRALRADIDEAAWEALYSATSRPMPIPDTGQIAVKVINHYGDEVMQVYDIGRAESAG